MAASNDMGEAYNPPVEGRLPDFLIIGAARSGTSSLFRNLADHPGIYSSRPKEIHYFDLNLDRGLQWYVSHFDGAHPQQKCGEATPFYLPNAAAIGAISKLIPGVKLIALLRDPVSRAWSHYWMRRERGLEGRSFDEAINDELKSITDFDLGHPDLVYLGHGLYAHHLRHVLTLFPRENLSVGLFETMRDSPDDFYRNICRFLAVADDYTPQNLGRRVNSYVTFRSLRVRRLAKRSPRQIQRIIGKLNARPTAEYPEMSPSTQDFLIDFFRKPNSELRDLLGLDLGSWVR